MRGTLTSLLLLLLLSLQLSLVQTAEVTGYTSYYFSTVPISSSTPTSTSEAALPTTTANTTSGGAAPVTPGAVSPAVSIIVPALIQCSQVSIKYIGPPLQKYLGIFVSGQQTAVETVTLAPETTSLTSGTFNWLVDLPIGLSVVLELYVLVNGSIPIAGSATTPDLIVSAGTSGNCLARNAGQNTQSIYALASSLDPGFRAGTQASSPVSSSVVVVAASNSSSSPNIGAIVGGVVAGLFIIPLLAFLILRSRRQRALAAQSDTFSMYSGREKSVVGGPGIPLPGTPSQSYYGGGAQEYGERIHSPTVDGHGGMEMGRYPAPSGTLPEPMDASTPDRGASPAESDTFHEGPQILGTEGLADPSSFLRGRGRD